MVAENTTKNANFIRIVTILRNLRDNGSITEQEYLRAKKYYLKLTGADIVLAGWLPKHRKIRGTPKRGFHGISRIRL